MFNRSSSAAATQSKGSGGQSKSTNGIVYHVFLDETDSLFQDLEIDESIRAEYIGAVQFRLHGAQTKSEDNLSIAFPKNLSINRLPLKNELISVTSGPGGFFYELITKTVTPNVTSTDDTASTTFGKSKASNKSAATYSKTFKTGITRSINDESVELDGYGDYFEYQPIHKLKLYEGDTLIESRFGQSIRFSGYNNTSNEYSPVVFIRNGESGLSSQRNLNETIEEDLNRDGTIILLGSGEYIFEYKPGTVDDKGKSDFETTPDTFKSYPSQLKGDQMLLNSGRIIISAKSGELIFYSKKNYGFISDGGLSVDNKFGIDITVGDNININTNDRNVNINSGNGKINLGDKSLESLVRGETLVDLMTQLIDAIVQQIYLTPAGPTSPGPTNLAVFQKIKSQLRTMLSTLNKTS
jgi:hypothetical protein